MQIRGIGGRLPVADFGNPVVIGVFAAPADIDIAELFAFLDGR